MSDFMLQYVLGNAAIALGLSLLAWFAGSVLKKPQITHFLWLLVIVKLLTPPLFSLPVVDSATLFSSPLGLETGVASSAFSHAANSVNTSTISQLDLFNWLGIIWLIGALILLVVSLRKILTFNRVLRNTICSGNESLQNLVREICIRIGVPKMPTVCTTSTHLAPFVWGMGKEVLLVLPQQVVAHISDTQLKGVIAHEVAHIKRRDHLVRWVEWIATVVFWWNPILWMAKYNLRIQEELACDSVAVANSSISSSDYAHALFEIVTLLASRSGYQPSFASQYTSGGQLKRRIEMIVSNKLPGKSPRWMFIAVILAAMVILPVGFGCQSESSLTEADSTDQPISWKTVTDSTVVTVAGTKAPLQLNYREVPFFQTELDSMKFGVPIVVSDMLQLRRTDIEEIEVPMGRVTESTVRSVVGIRIQETELPIDEAFSIKNDKLVLREVVESDQF